MDRGDPLTLLDICDVPLQCGGCEAILPHWGLCFASNKLSLFTWVVLFKVTSTLLAGTKFPSRALYSNKILINMFFYCCGWVGVTEWKLIRVGIWIMEGQHWLCNLLCYCEGTFLWVECWTASCLECINISCWGNLLFLWVFSWCRTGFKFWCRSHPNVSGCG